MNKNQQIELTIWAVMLGAIFIPSLWIKIPVAMCILFLAFTSIQGSK